MKRNIKTRYLKTAMYNIASRIRSDLVMNVCRVTETHFIIWITEAGCSKILWQVTFFEGCLTEVNIPLELLES